MLVKVSIENFKSFDRATELTMISSNNVVDLINYQNTDLLACL